MGENFEWMLFEKPNHLARNNGASVATLVPIGGVFVFGILMLIFSCPNDAMVLVIVM